MLLIRKTNKHALKSAMVREYHSVCCTGELTAHCMGPTKVAMCELYDQNDGTFTLNVKPQEPGAHVLQVKYGGEHVPGKIR